MVDEVGKEDEFNRESVLAVVEDRKRGGKSSVDNNVGSVGEVHGTRFGGEVEVLQDTAPIPEDSE